MGIYHTFSRSYANDQREHRVYIVVSGALIHATEQLYNLWLDCAPHITCREFMNCEEVHWLRSATTRSLNRTAARIARKFGLCVRTAIDYEDPLHTEMVLPMLTTYHHDMHCDNYKARLVNNACFTDQGHSGILFDVFSSEGLWVFMGPRDTTDYNTGKTPGTPGKTPAMSRHCHSLLIPPGSSAKRNN